MWSAGTVLSPSASVRELSTSALANRSHGRAHFDAPGFQDGPVSGPWTLRASPPPHPGLTESAVNPGFFTLQKRGRTLDSDRKRLLRRETKHPYWVGVAANPWLWAAAPDLISFNFRASDRSV